MPISGISFAAWFNRGFLEWRRIDWQSPTVVLEKPFRLCRERDLSGRRMTKLGLSMVSLLYLVSQWAPFSTWRSFSAPPASIAATCPTGWTATSFAAPSNAPQSPTISSRQAVA
jgi:hypothetical protein